MSEYSELLTTVIDGLPYPLNYTLENIEFALKYEPKSSDIIFATYPKCGTSWTQQIMYLILNDGKPQEDGSNVLRMSIESAGKDSFDSSNIIKTHLPFHLMPYNKSAKYLSIFRNPKDTCVSLYNHLNNAVLEYGMDLEFDQFFKEWMSGSLFYGDYFEHTLPYWSHRFDDNFTFLVYEHMKNNTRDAVLKIAKFVGDQYEAKLKENNELILNQVLENSSLKSMKAMVRTDPHVRKGIVGDWKNHLNEAQSDLIDDKVREVFTGTGLEELWVKEMMW